MFEKLLSFTKKVQDLPDQPTLTPNELKAQFDAAPEELRVHLNKTIDDVQASLNQGEWISAVLQNGWVPFNSEVYPVGYSKNGLGEVRLRGLVHKGTNNTTLMTLPEGYRPMSAEFLTCNAWNGSTVVPARVVINPAGRVDIVTNATGSDGTHYTSISGVTFSTR